MEYIKLIICFPLGIQSIVDSFCGRICSNGKGSKLRISTINDILLLRAVCNEGKRCYSDNSQSKNLFHLNFRLELESKGFTIVFPSDDA